MITALWNEIVIAEKENIDLSDRAEDGRTCYEQLADHDGQEWVGLVVYENLTKLFEMPDFERPK